jgi:hypothetical protein
MALFINPWKIPAHPLPLIGFVIHLNNYLEVAPLEETKYFRNPGARNPSRKSRVNLTAFL